MGPETALLAAAIASTAAAGVSTFQSVQQTNAASDAAEVNAQIQDQNARLARDKAVAREVATRREVRRQVARARAGMADSGLAPTGSSAIALEQLAMAGEFEALLARYGGDLQERGFAVDAGFARQNARNIRRTVPGTVLAGGLGVGASALAGYGDYGMNRAVSPNRTTPTAPAGVTRGGLY